MLLDRAFIHACTVHDGVDWVGRRTPFRCRYGGLARLPPPCFRFAASIHRPPFSQQPASTRLSPPTPCVCTDGSVRVSYLPHAPNLGARGGEAVQPEKVLRGKGGLAHGLAELCEKEKEGWCKWIGLDGSGHLRV